MSLENDLISSMPLTWSERISCLGAGLTLAMSTFEFQCNNILPAVIALGSSAVFGTFGSNHRQAREAAIVDLG